MPMVPQSWDRSLFVTLTYNLFVTRGLGHLAGSAQVLNPMQLPLHENLKLALETPGFLLRGKSCRYEASIYLPLIEVSGRVLAIWLTHSYAHTNKQTNFLPSSLKGADMALYEVAQALQLKCLLVPIITLEYGGYYDEGPRHLLQSKFCGFNEGRNHGSAQIDEFEYWGSEMPNHVVTWLNPIVRTKEDKESKKPQGDQGHKEV